MMSTTPPLAERMTRPAGTNQTYTLVYSVTKDRWYIRRFRSEVRVAGPFKTRDAAVKRLDALEAGTP